VLVAAGCVGAYRVARIRGGLELALLVALLALLPAGAIAWRARPPARPLPSSSGPDIILLVLDTTRRDHLSLYGYPEPTTPALDAFAATARVYEDAWSVAPWTSPSHASLFTGLLPAEHDTDGIDAPPLPQELVTLAGLLRDAGYRTAGFAANPNLHAEGWSRDFDVYRPPWVRGAHSLVSHLNAWLYDLNDPWRADRTTERVFADARAWWEANDGGRRFLFLNVLDPHVPYRAPPADLARFTRGRNCAPARRIAGGARYQYADTEIAPAVRACIRALYDAELYGMDREVGAFFAWLEERGELDPTLVAVTSDHGERLGEGGHVGHLLEMDQHLLRVPLILRHPQTLSPERVQRRVSLTGLPGFLLEQAGVRAPDVMARRSFGAANGGLAVAQHRHFGWYLARIEASDPAFDTSPFHGDWLAVADDQFLLRWSPAQGQESAQLFDYRDDPDLSRDLGAERPAARDALLRVARSLPAFPGAPPDPTRPPLDPEARARLRALGYVD
jgi:arylsulfatase A-like enzyme